MSTDQVLLVARARRLATSGEGAQIRIAAELSMAEVAAAIGVAVTTLWRWEHADRAPRGEPAAAWARLLDELKVAVA